MHTLDMKSIDITQLQAKDFARYLRTIVRSFGRHAEVGNQQYNAVEMWVRGLGFSRHFAFLLLGQIEWENEQGEIEVVETDWADLVHYIERSDGTLVTDAYETLQLLNESVSGEAYLFSQSEA